MRCVRPSHWFVLSLTFTCRPLLWTLNIATTPQATYPGEIMPELYDIINGIAQIEEMLCSLASPCFVMWVIKSGQCFYFLYHGLPTVSLTSTTPIPALANTPLRHQVSDQSKHRNIRASVVGSNKEDKWSLPWVPRPSLLHGCS